MGSCFCTGACRTLGYCPNARTAPWRPAPVYPNAPPRPFVPLPTVPEHGWRCPSCGAGIAPFMPVCPYCAPKRGDDGPVA